MTCIQLFKPTVCAGTETAKDKEKEARKADKRIEHTTHAQNLANGQGKMHFLQVLLGDNCHIYNYEGGGISALGGLAFHVIHNEANGELSLDALKESIRCCTYCLLGVCNTGIQYSV